MNVMISADFDSSFEFEPPFELNQLFIDWSKTDGFGHFLKKFKRYVSTFKKNKKREQLYFFRTIYGLIVFKYKKDDFGPDDSDLLIVISLVEKDRYTNPGMEAWRPGA